jgi:purine-binding chemotaxis protein CheW
MQSASSTAAPATAYLTLRIGADPLGIELADVREIVAWTRPTRVPGLPPWILGVVNLRGTVLPIVDLGVKFGYGPTAVGTRSCVVVVDLALDSEMATMGVLAESVDTVLEVAADQVDPPPPFGSSIRVEFLRGLARGSDGWVQLLDIQKVLRHDEMILVAGAAEADDPGEPEPPSAALA